MCPHTSEIEEDPRLSRRRRWLTPCPCKSTSTENVWYAGDETKAIHILMSLEFKLGTDSNSLLLSSQSPSLLSPVQKIPTADIWKVYCSKAKRWGESCMNADFFWHPMGRGSKPRTDGSLLTTDGRVLDPGTVGDIPGKSGVKLYGLSFNEFQNTYFPLYLSWIPNSTNFFLFHNNTNWHLLISYHVPASDLNAFQCNLI